MNDDTLRNHIRKARGKFIAMAVTYALGVFNDNFFKQAAMLIAVAAGNSRMQGRATVIFAVPYLLFAAYAGWMADRFSKRKVVIGAKILELAAMLLGAVGICTGQWTLILAMVGTMGLQSAIFSPALNGSIPELYPRSYVTTANAILKVGVTAAILLGFAVAGFALGAKGADIMGISRGRFAVAATAVGVSFLGMLTSFGVPFRPAAAPHVRFPLAGPFDTIRELGKILKDRLLATVVATNALIWCIGSVQILVINQLGLKELLCDASGTSKLVVAQLVGIAVGGVVSSRLAKGPRWYRHLPFAMLAMGTLMVLMNGVRYVPENMQWTCAMVLLAGIGMSGGAILVPCESFIQVRPVPEHKGAVIAAANFAVFCGILVSGPVANVLNAHLLPTVSYGIIGGVALAAGAALLILLLKNNHVD